MMICSQHVPRTCKNCDNLKDCEDNWDYKEYKACALNIEHWSDQEPAFGKR